MAFKFHVVSTKPSQKCRAWDGWCCFEPFPKNESCSRLGKDIKHPTSHAASPKKDGPATKIWWSKGSQTMEKFSNLKRLTMNGQAKAELHGRRWCFSHTMSPASKEWLWQQRSCCSKHRVKQESHDTSSIFNWITVKKNKRLSLQRARAVKMTFSRNEEMMMHYTSLYGIIIRIMQEGFVLGLFRT